MKIKTTNNIDGFTKDEQQLLNNMYYASEKMYNDVNTAIANPKNLSKIHSGLTKFIENYDLIEKQIKSVELLLQAVKLEIKYD